MQHLTAEALARLVDEAPAAEEAQHVRDCLVCRRELEELREMTAALADLPPLEPAPEAWFALEARLRSEGLVREGAAAAPPALFVHRWRPALRVAAALTLFLLGGVSGAVLWNARRPAQVADSGRAPVDPATLPVVGVVHSGALPASTGAGVTTEAGTALVADPAPEAATPVDDGVRLVSAGQQRQPAPEPRAPRSAPRNAAADRAERELEEAEQAYLAALERYAAVADPESGADPLTRLAALERLVAVTRDALDRTPGDPVINGYHMAALTERDAVRRELARSSRSQWF